MTPVKLEHVHSPVSHCLRIYVIMALTSRVSRARHSAHIFVQAKFEAFRVNLQKENHFNMVRVVINAMVHIVVYYIEESLYQTSNLTIIMGDQELLEGCIQAINVRQILNRV